MEFSVTREVCVEQTYAECNNKANFQLDHTHWESVQSRLTKNLHAGESIWETKVVKMFHAFMQPEGSLPCSQAPVLYIRS
jgi:hypothetical protein